VATYSNAGCPILAVPGNTTDRLCLARLEPTMGMTEASLEGGPAVLEAIAVAADDTLLVAARDVSPMGMGTRFIAKYQPSQGTFNELWRREITGAGSQVVTSMSVSRVSGRIAVAGNFTQEVNLPPTGPNGTTPSYQAGTGNKAWWALLDPDGYHLNSDAITGGFVMEDPRIAFDPFNDDLVFTLTAEGSVAIAPCTDALATTGVGVTMTKFESDGTCLWSRLLSRQAGTDPGARIHDTVVAGNSNIFVVGGLDTTTDVELSPLPDLSSAGGDRGFTAIFGP
jgi:hypothetical protein